MTAKAQGKNRIVLYEEEATQRPGMSAVPRDLRSIAHLKMLQTLSGKLNRLNDVREIGDEIAAELRPLIDYHNCRVFVVDGTDDLVPVAFRGDLATEAAALPLELLRTRIGKGVTGRCAERGESILVPDAAKCEFGTRIAGTPVIEESLLAVPLLYGSKVVGVIVVSKLGLDQFDEADVRLLEVLAGHAAVAVENARLYESARREAQGATALLEFGRELAAASGLDEIVERVVELSASLLGFPRTSIWLESDGWLVPQAFNGHTAAERFHVESLRLDPARTDPEREPYVVTPEEYADVLPDPPFPGASYAIAPFEVDGRVGCISAVIGDECFGERQLRLLGGLAQQTKLALANASSYEGLERTFVSTIEALANALEANDEYTSTHARAIRDLALRVGRELGLDELSLKRVELGALLHDIGKIGIPSDVLSKPGRLTPGERAVMERHPLLGERIIAPIDRLQDVRPVVLHCHERWDGRGYPDGLAGEEIPVEARIVFVCAAYHAMTTDRPYRARLAHTEALHQLEESAGSQFDPRVVDAAVSVLGRVRGLR